ncbi:uncharacterized protein SAPINGB_P002768 [Magnusiomyces paraingens]|uniref:mannan endo-1,6-alpha-mannosidase n=1 Tax=Magnusiomyces paraingens TaxID=2606893 RepID=A0A5E8BHU1_9ASCO|nr:uncharacterized protein SAPINGB_P002768 [Saprochaete ingens]VVT50452.1 unnamed protein product [Saprochaete ingens]
MLVQYTLFLFATCVYQAWTLDMDTNSADSVKSGLSQIAKGIIDYYNGHDPGNSPGMFVSPYYWWQSGAAWGSILDYWYFTEDTKYNEYLYDSLLWQAGPNFDYLPENQTRTEGNDDQGYWGITLMSAAERGFQAPYDGQPSWSERVENIVKSMISRWDTDNCGGGLRWQIYPWNNGYDYKNTVANGCLFHLSARLSRFNGDNTYIEWAEKTWDWMVDHNYIVTNTSAYKIMDGATIDSNCMKISPEQWTYNAGLMLSGAAYLYDHTKDSKWLDRAQAIWNGSKIFFKSNTYMYEASCQISNRCNNDQRSFKAYFSRFLGLTSDLLPEISDDIMNYLRGTVPGVLSSCTGGSDGHTCGLDWSAGKWDGFYGLGEQMSALETIQNAFLLHSKPGPANKNSEESLQDQLFGFFGPPKKSTEGSSTNTKESSSSDSSSFPSSSWSESSSTSWTELSSSESTSWFESSSSIWTESSSTTWGNTDTYSSQTDIVTTQAPQQETQSLDTWSSPATEQSKVSSSSTWEVSESTSTPDIGTSSPDIASLSSGSSAVSPNIMGTSGASVAPIDWNQPSTTSTEVMVGNSPNPTPNNSLNTYSEFSYPSDAPAYNDPVSSQISTVSFNNPPASFQTSASSNSFVQFSTSSSSSFSSFSSSISNVAPTPVYETVTVPTPTVYTTFFQTQLTPSVASKLPLASHNGTAAQQLPPPIQVQGKEGSSICDEPTTFYASSQYPRTAKTSVVGVKTISTITHADGAICEVLIRTIDIYG